MRSVSIKLCMALAAALLLAPNPQAVAQQATAVVPDGCDAIFHDTLRSRAWMEAQREIEVSQALITKPASVFDLTCYSAQLAQTKSIGIFAANLAGQIDSVINTANMLCQNMKDISEQLRCSDADKAKIFPEFSDLKDGNLRGSCEPEAHWQDAIAIVFPDELPRKPDKAGPDEFASFFEVMDPKKCQESAFISSGVEFKYNIPDVGDKTKVAGTCLAAGCVFDGNGCVKDIPPSPRAR